MDKNSLKREHYLNLIRNASDKIFNWAFTLNSSGFLATISFMGATVKWCSPTERAYIFTWLTLIFGMGIVFIVMAVTLEHIYFSKKQKFLSENGENFKKKKIEIKYFRHCFKGCIQALKILSYSLFFIGLFLASYMLLAALNNTLSCNSS